jgi:DNA (cytosine-5)-methyltransferase 1
MTQPRILSLFSGIGALDRAVEIVTGGRTVTQVEAVPYRRAVLAKHWPNVQRHDDVCSYNATPGQFDVLCGGFPCRDISPLGSKQGIEGKHSGLWFQYLRIIKEAQPHAIFIENVADLRTRGLDTVLQGLAEIGCDAAWTISRATEVGGQINRARVFLLAVTETGRLEGVASAWLRRNALSSVPDTHRCNAALPQPTSRAGQGFDGVEPGLHRASLGSPRGLDARRRRERVGSLGDTVVVEQAVMSYHWCLEQLR